MSELHNIVPSHLASASKSQKLIFFETLLCLSAADGVQDDDEIKFISDNAKINGIDIEELENHCDPDTILQDVQKIKNRALALELIREMCFLAHVDNELSDEEENTLTEDSGIVGTWEGEDAHHKPIATINSDGTRC